MAADISPYTIAVISDRIAARTIRMATLAPGQISAAVNTDSATPTPRDCPARFIRVTSVSEYSRTRPDVLRVHIAAAPEAGTAASGRVDTVSLIRRPSLLVRQVAALGRPPCTDAL